MAPPRSSPPTSPGRTRGGRGRAPRGPGASTRCTWAPPRPRAPSTRSSPGSPRCKELGVTTLELLPLASFPGARNWGYDGVDLFAPQANYGGPEGLRRLIDAAHAQGLAVLIDAVYNHFGPDGNYLRCYSPHYFTGRHHTPWGEAVNYDGDGLRGGARAGALQRGDVDPRLPRGRAAPGRGPRHRRRRRARTCSRRSPQRARAAAPGRRVVVIAEDERNEHPADAARRRKAAMGLDGVWADDLHHQLRRAFAGRQRGLLRRLHRQRGGHRRDAAPGLVLRGPEVEGPRAMRAARPRAAGAVAVRPLHPEP